MIVLGAGPGRPPKAGSTKPAPATNPAMTGSVAASAAAPPKGPTSGPRLCKKIGLAAFKEINPAAAINLKMRDTTFMAFILVRGQSAEETLLFTVRDVKITENIKRHHEIRI